jgi:serine/threonine protein phosphatase PrpC
MENQVKIEQSNFYRVYDSMGRGTEIGYFASNFNQAFEQFKNDKANFQKHYYGKLKRAYNGGVRGSMAG